MSIFKINNGDFQITVIQDPTNKTSYVYFVELVLKDFKHVTDIVRFKDQPPKVPDRNIVFSVRMIEKNFEASSLEEAKIFVTDELDRCGLIIINNYIPNKRIVDYYWNGVSIAKDMVLPSSYYIKHHLVTSTVLSNSIFNIHVEYYIDDKRIVWCGDKFGYEIRLNGEIL